MISLNLQREYHIFFSNRREKLKYKIRTTIETIFFVQFITITVYQQKTLLQTFHTSFVNSQHQNTFSRCDFVLKKPALNVCFKYFWYTDSDLAFQIKLIRV